MRERAIAVREALLRHRWAIGLMESRRNADEFEYGLDVVLDGLERTLAPG